ncbi:peroxiredoxin [Candidatus Peregrinibacteria bacterium]|nr:MAG: peroxiredoxin [Candidatus Peregrinibacteria bacterium]
MVNTLPIFSLPASDGNTYTEQDFQSGLFILYAYPRDMTSGCTLEAQQFQKLLPEFTKKDVKIFGISGDSLRKHASFCKKESLSFSLLADEERKLLSDLGTLKEKSMYGKTYIGIERSTFLIRDGNIEKEWRNVTANGHAEEVLSFLSSKSTL